MFPVTFRVANKASPVYGTKGLMGLGCLRCLPGFLKKYILLYIFQVHHPDLQKALYPSSIHQIFSECLLCAGTLVVLGIEW